VRSLRIATRNSPLALWQAQHVKALLERAHLGLRVELVPMTTSGDRLRQRRLAEAGGKGLFVKELEQALSERRADLAVHSMKDVPAQLPEGLCLGAFLPADDPRDALVCVRYARLAELPPGAVVGTASLRRQAQLRVLRPDLRLAELHGNVGSRLRRLVQGEYDALLLAQAGLNRLGLSAHIRESFAVETFVPAIAQGVIGLECRADDRDVRALLAPLHDSLCAVRLDAERAFGARLGGACTVPVGGHAVVEGARLKLTGLIAAPDGSRLVRGAIEGARRQARQLGERLAEQLLAAGGRDILAALGAHA
jgi:hydroxymethylbilane synthase